MSVSGWEFSLGWLSGRAVWYFKVRSRQKSVVTMTGEYQTAEKGRKDSEEKRRRHE